METTIHEEVEPSEKKEDQRDVCTSNKSTTLRVADHTISMAIHNNDNNKQSSVILKDCRIKIKPLPLI